MVKHILLPDVDLATLELLPAHKDWLSCWLQETQEELEKGYLSTAWCLQGVFAEMLLQNEIQTDWAGAISELLTDENGNPLAYSEAYGEKLYKFTQWKQSPIHAIHTHWWVNRFLETPDIDYAKYAHLIVNFIQPNTWIYNPDVSQTGIRTRMRSELMMSLAMGIEILYTHGELDDRRSYFEAHLSSIPITPYLSAEYFRMKALEILNALHHAPGGFTSLLDSCETDSGYCDFNVKAKRDDYMGTQKRTGRDKPKHSAISSLHAWYIAQHSEVEAQQKASARMKDFGKHLATEPLDIPAFRMRDIDIPFGTDISPFEVMAGSYITTFQNG